MPIRRTRDGRFRVHLDPAERDSLRGLARELRAVLEQGGAVARRLFPPAYTDDADAAAEFDRLMREDLLGAHRANVDTFEGTLDAEVLDEPAVEGWLAAVNALRLVLGTAIGVTEESDAADFEHDDAALATYGVYQGLSWLAERIVHALMQGVPPQGRPGAPEAPPELGD